MRLAQIRTQFRTPLQPEEQNVDRLLSRAREIVVFGSRATGLHRGDSDLDMLIVTSPKQRILCAGLDCVVLTPEEIEQEFWLGSELAVHIARYGKWVTGLGAWTPAVHVSDRSVARKRQRIIALARNAAQRWPRLHPIFHEKYRTTLRRECQRLRLLIEGCAVPPTALLDSSWQSSGQYLAELARTIEEPITERFLQALSEQEKRVAVVYQDVVPDRRG